MTIPARCIPTAVRRLLAVAAIALLALSPRPLLGHAPELHRFNLVAFNRPIPAPDFALPDLAGATVRLEQFRGRWVLLNFWATWCPPCVKEMPSMEALYRRYPRERFVVVAVSTDREGKAVVEPFVDRLALTFPILLDAKNRIGAAYGARDLPASFLLDPEGRVVAAAKGERDWGSGEALSYLDELIGAP